MFLTQQEYINNAKELGGGTHWSNFDARWDYHNKAINVLKENGVDKHSKILEIGTMGIQLVLDSDVLDIETKKWKHNGKSPTFLHDATQIPWPVEPKYDWAIAMRVIQHVPRYQQSIFNEMKRVAKNVLIIVPEKYKDNGGITLDDFVSMNNGINPTGVMNTEFGNLFYWLKT